MNDNVVLLTINAGSSSIKFALFSDAEPPCRIVSGAIEGIGQPQGKFKVEGNGVDAENSRELESPTYAKALGLLHDWIQSQSDRFKLSAIGHRVVQGGPKYITPSLISPELINALREYSPFDIEHLPQEIKIIESFQKAFPALTQVACFDTYFHRDLPRVAQLLPIPRHFEKQGVRRFGFHGLSYQFLWKEMRRISNANRDRIIFAHLGAGASLAAVRDGKSIDTSMGFTPNGGVPMATRSGDLDPGVLYYLANNEKLNAKEISGLLNLQSGLLGVSETSGDMRTLLKNEVIDVRAAEAVELFCYQVKKTIGAYAAALGGLDTLVFSGGIGENAPVVRGRICDGLKFLNIEIDSEKNTKNAAVISLDEALVKIHVIHTDEEQIIADEVRRLLHD